MNSNLRGRYQFEHIGYLILDEVCLQAALLVAFYIRHQTFAYDNPIYKSFGLLLILIDLLVAMMNDSFRDAGTRGYYIEAVETVRHAFFVFTVSMIYMFAMQYGEAYSRITFALMFVLHIVFGYVARALLRWYGSNHKKSGVKLASMLVVTTPRSAKHIIKKLTGEGESFDYRITGIVLTESKDNENNNERDFDGIPVVCGIDEAPDYVCREWVDSVYIDAPLTNKAVVRLMEDCGLMGVPTHYHMTELGESGIQRYSERIGDTTVLTATINHMTPAQAMIKRAFDIIGGLVGSLIALLIMLVVSPMIKKASPGPVLFKQERVGRNGKRFTMYKIRTMHVDADMHKSELESQNNVDDGMMFKMDFDPRVIGNEVLPDGTKKTGIGDYLRRHSLDEFPQFFNVLMGQMSLVGTRPPTVDEYEKYQYHHKARLSMKPGITGLWQVSGRSDITDFEEVVKLDTEYIMNWTPGLDLRILFKTIRVVFTGEGAK